MVPSHCSTKRLHSNLKKGNRFIASAALEWLVTDTRPNPGDGASRKSEGIDSQGRKEGYITMHIDEAVRTLEQKYGLSQSERAERAARSVAHLQD